ncbi:MAG TPA: RagB/SusD family nutrient uptake outer membrane protein, partial [Chitinophagaceae bacterium]|nr:RagB/SusD family nutrient uptake outer membrane protein [Chitinophagaceae bacterium]
MKKISTFLCFTLLAMVWMTGCRKKLEEEPRSLLTPEFFSTEQGFQKGLDAAYASTRLIWGNQDYFTITVIGTDEFKRGIDGNSDINVYSSAYNATTGVINANWRNAYTFINTYNG